MQNICLTLLCAGLLCGQSYAELQKLTQDTGQPDYAKIIPPEKLKEDLDFLFKTIEEVHPNMYAYISKEEFASVCDDLYREINHPMSCAEFYKLVTPVVAELRNDHTFVDPISFKDGGAVFPISVDWDGTNLILENNYGSEALPRGGKILAFNGEEASEVVQRISRYHAAEGKNANPQIVEACFFLWFWLRLEYGSTEPLVLTIKSIDGKTKDCPVKPLGIGEAVQNLEKTRSKLNIAEGQGASESYTYIPMHDAGLIKISGFSANHVAFQRFLKQTFSQIRDSNVSNLIVDIRGNTGGDSGLGDILLDYLTDKPFRQFEKCQVKVSIQAVNLGKIEKDISQTKPKGGSVITGEVALTQPTVNPLRFSGRKFLLIDGAVYSSANSFASAIKCFEIATSIGEETGGKTACYGDVLRFHLPNSRLDFEVAHKFFVEACGKPDGRGVIPDYEVKQTPEDTAKGVDTVLQFTLELIKKADSGMSMK